MKQGNGAPPDGTRFVTPESARLREAVTASLASLYDAWGYEPVEVPALERYDVTHPRAEQSFKLSDRDSGVLALRSDFTPALAQLVRAYHPAIADGERRALRYRYAGTVWHAIDPEFARTREFTQVGLELIGVSNARADAEVIHLARETVRAVGLVPRVELGNPGFVRALFDLAEVRTRDREALADAIDRKDRSDLRTLLAAAEVRGPAAEALLEATGLYGDAGVLREARRVAPWPETRAEIDRLEGVLDEFEDDSELLIDLGMARRLSYYTGVTFRAYTFDYGQPLLGGGRYDGALLPYAAGFSMGLERILGALPQVDTSTADTPQIDVSRADAPRADAPRAETRDGGTPDSGARAATGGLGARLLCSDDAVARRLREAGFRVLRATATDPSAVEDEAVAQDVGFVVHAGGLVDLASDGGGKRVASAPDHARVREALRAALEERA